MISRKTLPSGFSRQSNVVHDRFVLAETRIPYQELPTMRSTQLTCEHRAAGREEADVAVRASAREWTLKQMRIAFLMKLEVDVTVGMFVAHESEFRSAD
jgi:hypothetical protein